MLRTRGGSKVLMEFSVSSTSDVNAQLSADPQWSVVKMTY